MPPDSASKLKDLYITEKPGHCSGFFCVYTERDETAADCGEYRQAAGIVACAYLGRCQAFPRSFDLGYFGCGFRS
jgi:hypothetical protein